MSDNLITLNNLKKYYKVGTVVVKALKGIEPLIRTNM